MIKCCIFDLDGTLLNTLTTITHYVNLVFKRHNIEGISEEECKSFIGDGARNLILRALRSKGISDADFAESILKEYNKEYNSDTTYLTEPYPEIREVLAALKERGILLGILSNKPDATTRFIIPNYFPETFDIVRGGVDGVPLKPDPTSLVNMISSLSVSPSEVMYLGDTGVDIKTGIAAGVLKTVGVSWGFRDREELISKGARIIIDSPKEILFEVESDD